MNKKNVNLRKYLFIILLPIFLIIILIIQMRNIFEKSKNIRKIIYKNEINYKGENILKSRLINNYLSKIPNNQYSDKEKERMRFNEYFNLADYSNEAKIQSELKNKFLKEISKMKNESISELDTFYISHIINFGNNLITINNVIFYCEIVGCHKIILNNQTLKRRWLIKKPVYYKKANITMFI